MNRSEELHGDTSSVAYAEFLQTVRRNLQAPYRYNLSRLKLGRTLDIGCGIGRNLIHLDGVGIDHNQRSVDIARAQGLQAFTPSEFQCDPGSFDSLLFAHVLEHMDLAAAGELVGRYLKCLKPGGRVVFITPQEWGYKTDTTHVEFMDFPALRALAVSLGLIVERAYSFPFPRWAGRLFKYNEFVLVSRRGAA